jgi:UDP-N-acetylmuramoyl-L-alanyl-D-glutamate--2,6-diaminopimelate ligase
MIGDIELHTERTTPESNELQELFAKMYDAGCEYVVMEVSSHALFLDRVYGITFEAAVFTNLTEDHLDFHPTMEDYGKAKAILFTMCRKGAVNIDDEYAHLMLEAATAPILKYSMSDSAAELHAEDVVLHDDSVSFTAVYNNEKCNASLAIPGKFSVYNALSAISAAIMLGIELKSAVAALAQCHGVMGRAEVVPTGRDFTIIIDYAHTPDALENIISTVRGIARGRVVTLFGCGGDRDSKKRPIMGSIAAEKSDFVIVTSDNPRTEEPGAIINDILQGMQDTKTPYVVIENRREAIGWAIKNAQPRDIIILAGKGHETYQILGREKVHFDEREVVAEYLSE